MPGNPRNWKTGRFSLSTWQISELKALAEREGLTIVCVMQELRSAKQLGRPVFADMMARIARGEASGILVEAGPPRTEFHRRWTGDRNDPARVVQHIRSFERSYYPEDNVLLMAVELGMANQFSRDLAVNVKRGLRTKAQMGWYPVQPPLGYMNSPIQQ